MKSNPFSEFLNIAGDLYDQYEIGEDGEPKVYKSENLLELMKKFKDWNDEFGVPLEVTEDKLDYLVAKSSALGRLIEEFGLKVE